MSERESKKDRLGVPSALIITGALTAGGLYGGYNIVSDFSKETLGDEHAIFDAAYQFLTQDECITRIPPAADSEGVIFTDDTDTKIVLPPQNIRPKSEYISSSRVSEIAQENDLTVHSNAFTVNSINTAEDFDEVLDILNTYTSSFDLDVEVPTSKNFVDMNKYQLFNRDKYGLEEFKKRGIEISDVLATLPEEVFRLGQIKTLKIVGDNNFDGIGSSFLPDTNPRSYFNPYTNQLTIRLGDQKDSDAFQRSFTTSTASAIDISICGLKGAEFDNIYTSLFENSEGEKTNSDANEIISGLEIIVSKANLFGKYISPNQNFNITEASPLDQNRVALQVQRIDVHVPGYFRYWKELTKEYFPESIREIDQIIVKGPTV